jgi:hypothetical protein
MKFIDEKGRLWGRVSIIDILIILAVIGVGLSFVYKRTSPEVGRIVNADTTFYVTMVANQLREFSVNAIAEGDIIYEQYERQALGRVVKLEVAPATEYLLKTDGTAMLAEMEDRYKVFITLECVGNINEEGFYANGIRHVAVGREIVLVSNRVILPDSLVYAISETKP